jgi:predicted peroxiredoxin
MQNTKFAIVLMAPESSPDGRGRLLHAFTTAIDLIEAGAEVEFFFDGIGVECITAFHEKANPFSDHYSKLFEQVLPHAKACGVCTKHFGAEEAARKVGVELVSHDRHRSLAHFALAGTSILTF